MGNSEFKTERKKILEEISFALFKLRDALVELSLSVKDWQFEADGAKRKMTEQAVKELLQRIAEARNSSA